MYYYSHHFEQIKKKYPDLYLKLMDKPSSIIKGYLNALLSSKININDEEAVRGFFKSNLILDAYLDDSII